MMAKHTDSYYGLERWPSKKRAGCETREDAIYREYLEDGGVGYREYWADEQKKNEKLRERGSELESALNKDRGKVAELDLRKQREAAKQAKRHQRAVAKAQ